MKPVFVGPHVSMADETLHRPIAFERWAGRHKACRLNVRHRGIPAARGRYTVLVDGTVSNISSESEVIDVAEVNGCEAPARALEHVGGGGAVITGQRHFSQVTVVGGPVVVEVMLAVPIRVQGGLVHGLQRTLGVREFVRTVIAILVTVLKVPRWDRT